MQPNAMIHHIYHLLIFVNSILNIILYFKVLLNISLCGVLLFPAAGKQGIKAEIA
jgi:hypothetical protein